MRERERERERDLEQQADRLGLVGADGEYEWGVAVCVAAADVGVVASLKPAQRGAPPPPRLADRPHPRVALRQLPCEAGPRAGWRGLAGCADGVEWDKLVGKAG